jgi:hypothetical protein
MKAAYKGSDVAAMLQRPRKQIMPTRIIPIAHMSLAVPT